MLDLRRHDWLKKGFTWACSTLWLQHKELWLKASELMKLRIFLYFDYELLFAYFAHFATIIEYTQIKLCYNFFQHAYLKTLGILPWERLKPIPLSFLVKSH